MTENSDWGLQAGYDDLPYYPYKQGRYRFRLLKIVPGERKKFDDPQVKERVVRFIFSPSPGQQAFKDMDVDTHKCEVVVTCTAKLGKKTKIYELACALDPSGIVPEELLENPEAFKARCQSYIGLEYTALLGPNNAGKIYKLSNFALVSHHGEEAPRQQEAPQQETSAPKTRIVYRYNVPGTWEESKRNRARKLLTDAGAKEYPENSWDSPKQIPQLSKIESIINEDATNFQDDDIPF